MQNGFNVKAEALARAKFPPLKHDRGFETRPFIVVDKAGEIGLWHLPSVISKCLQSMVEKATSELHQKAPTLFKVGNGPATRCDPSLFRTSATNMWGHGTACLCYCWFQQAHDVSALPCSFGFSDNPRRFQTKSPAHRAPVSNIGRRFWNTLIA